MRHLSGFMIAATLSIGLNAQTAGRIVARVAPAAVVKPPSKVGLKQEYTQAAIGMRFHWGDSLQTDDGGRIRVQMIGGSLVSIGSKTRLIVRKHDARAQQSAFDLEYGTIRLKVVQLTQPDSSFEIRTMSCVLGALDAPDFIVDASNPVGTIVTVLGGTVWANDSTPGHHGLQLKTGQQWRSDETEPTRISREDFARLKSHFPEKP
jgi:ferric-dicitrate binding protein FerR (iron transport regulator)